MNFGSGNVYLEKIGGLIAGIEFDNYVIVGNLSFGGTLKLEWWNGFTGAAGQTFDIFDWGTTDGAFSTLDFSGAQLASGLIWHTSKLYLTGEIGITAVPEPESWAMLLAGLGLVGGAARRARRALEIAPALPDDGHCEATTNNKNARLLAVSLREFHVGQRAHRSGIKPVAHVPKCTLPHDPSINSRKDQP